MLATTRYHGAACKTCRRRGRKCTRELPTCQSCQNRGLECEGYELKWAGLASRGFLAGKDASRISDHRRRRSAKDVTRQKDRQEPSNDAVQSLPNDQSTYEPLPLNHILCPTWSTLNFEISSPLIHESVPASLDVEIVEEPFTPVADEEVVAFSYQISPLPAPRPALSFFEIPPNLSFIMNYHLQRVSAKLCVDNDALINPYRHYIYPLALQKPALLYACAAMSSVHYSTCEGNEHFFVEGLRLRGKSLKRLQESMWSRDGALDESNLATILMLVLCDMCMGSHSNFEMWFTFAKSLMDARGQLKTHDNFVEQYISWLDIMSCASTSRRPVFSSDNIISFRNSMADWSHDVVPCAVDVFDILHEIVALYKEDFNMRDTTAEVELLKARVTMCPPRTERGMPWHHLTEAYRHAVLLYTSLLFELEDDEDEIAWLVSSIVHHAKSTPSNNGWSAQLLWPLFHAGLKIADERRQEWLKGMFRNMESLGGFRNVSTAQKALEMVWTGQFTGKYIDLLVQENLGDLIVV